jgi:hypothetical protein
MSLNGQNSVILIVLCYGVRPVHVPAISATLSTLTDADGCCIRVGVVIVIILQNILHVVTSQRSPTSAPVKDHTDESDQTNAS